jgi:2-oxoglutarate dehydrogenase E2 component (dihydrolipoamide succinyltransferase)
MSIEVKIPAVGESISSGVVSVWHKKSGDFVNPGDALFTLETEKVSTEIVAENAGVLEAKAAEGQEVKIGEVVAIIDDSKAPEEIPPAGKKPTLVEKKKEPTPPEMKAAAASKQKSTGADVLSPAVRRIVEEEHLEPAKISGTGKDGRLTKGDVLAAAQPEEKKEDRDRQAKPDTERFIRKKMSPLRRKIAAQLVMAQQTAAILTTFNESDMSAVQELRAKLQEGFTKKNGIKLGLMSFFIKAAVEALKAVPVVNGRIEEDDFIQNNF